MKKWIAATAALALLGGCVKMDKTPPTDMPDYAKLYPGAQPMMRMSMGPLSAEVETTTDKPDDVIAYYRTQAAADGLTERTGAQSAQQQITFTDPTGSKMLVIGAKASSTGTVVSIAYKPKAAS